MMGMAVCSLYLPSEGAVKGQPKRRWPWRQHCHLCLHLSIPGGRAGPTVEESGSRPILSDPTTARDQALPGRLMGRGGKLPSPQGLGAQLCTAVPAGSFRQGLGPQAAPLLCTAAFPARVPLLGGLPHAGASAEALFSILTQYIFTSSPSSSHTPTPSPVHKRAGALPRAPGQRSLPRHRARAGAPAPHPVLSSGQNGAWAAVPVPACCLHCGWKWTKACCDFRLGLLSYETTSTPALPQCPAGCLQKPSASILFSSHIFTALSLRSLTGI